MSKIIVLLHFREIEDHVTEELTDDGIFEGNKLVAQPDEFEFDDVRRLFSVIFIATTLFIHECFMLVKIVFKTHQIQIELFSRLLRLIFFLNI